jgi:hypothetical protein
VTVQLTSGRAIALRVWLNDNVTATTLTALDGVQFSTLVLFPVPRLAGSWHLWASADDAAGCHAQTGVVRTVTVQ